jgi:hypothetical protein
MLIFMYQAMPRIPLREDFLFHVDLNTNPSILGTLYSSCSQVSTRIIISISLEIQLNIDPFLHGKPWNLHERIQSVSDSYLLLSFFFISIYDNIF